MAEFRVQLGAVADLATSEEVAQVEKNVLRHIDKIEDRKWDNNKIFTKGIGSGNFAAVPAGAPFIIGVNGAGAAVGRLGNLTYLIALGNDDHTAASGVTVSWYIGQNSAPLQPDLAMCIYPAMPVPFADSITRECLWIKPNESVFGVVNGATGSQNITLIAHVSNYPDYMVAPRGV